MTQQLKSDVLNPPMAAESRQLLPSNAGSAAPSTLALDLVVHPNAIAEDWDRLEQAGCCSVYQTRGYVSAWLDSFVARGLCQPAIAGLRHEGRLICILPFAVRAKHGLRIGEFIGGSHSNHNLPLFSPEHCDLLTPATLNAALLELARRLKIDAFEFRRQPLEWNGVANPLPAAMQAVPSPTIAQDVRLEDGFDAVLKRHRGSAKLKKLRAKERIFATVGGYEIIWGNTPDLRRKLLGALFAQKTAQFSKKGIRNVFAEPATRDFFFALADSRTDPPVIELAALTSAGAIRAVRAYGIHKDRLSLMMQSYTEDDLSRASPGETLLFRSMEEFCKRGFRHVDFGVGRERYKDSWADAEIALADSAIGITSAGRFFVTAGRLRYLLERRIRKDERLWSAFKSARRLIKGRKTAPSENLQPDDGE